MKYIKLFFFVLIGFLMAECQSERYEEMKGGFKISLGEDVTVSVRSVPTELGKPATDNFSLKIVKENDGTILYDGAYRSEIIPASVGTYTVTAACGENPVLALDAPYYKGDSTGVEVKEGQTANITLRCKVANALASIAYAEGQQEKFKELFSTYGVEVKVGNNSVNISDGSKQSAYYQAGSIPTFTFKGVLKDNNQAVSKVIESEKLSAAAFGAGKHCILTLSLKPATSGAVITVEKVEVESVTITETIPVSWLPAPKICGFNNGQNSITYIETDNALSAKLGFTGSSPIQDVEFSFDFQDLQEKYQVLNNKTFLLSQLSEEDRRLFNVASIILPNLDGTASGQFDFTAMTSGLQTLAGGMDAVNTINLRVKANDRWSSEVPTAYQIVTTKPIFQVSAYPGNIWTKEFTMNALMEEQVLSGSYSIINSNIIYQYSTENNGKWMDLNEDLCQKNLVPGTTYYIRGLYRKEIASEVAEIKTYPLINLENGGLEVYTKEGEDGKIFDNYGARFYWDGWANLNELTCDECPWAAYAYNTRSGTRPVSGSDAYNGTSAWIATIGWGYGSTIGGTNIQTPGELFLGTLTNVDHGEDTATKQYGITYESRPTGISFWYKYMPYDGDRTDIYVQILHDDIILGDAQLQNAERVDSYTLGTLHINYRQEADKLILSPNKLILVFKSGSNNSVYNYGSSGRNNVRFVGSELYIDDITLIYDK